MKKLLILLMALVCTSCTALPTEERAFAVALCVEKEGGIWQVYARIPAYKTGGEYLTVTGKGSDISYALADLDASAPMHTALSQLRLLVLSDKLAAEDVSAMFEAMSALYDLRQQCAVAVTDGSAKEAAEALKPETGARLSKAIDVLLEARISQGIIPCTELADVLRMQGRQSPALMRLSLREGKLDLSGAYPVDGDGQILAPLDAEETTLLTMLLGDAKEHHLRLNGAYAHVRDVCVKVALDEDLYIARVTLTMQTLSSSLAPDALEQAIAEECVQLLSRLSAAGCDVLGLGRKAILCGDNLTQWHARLREIRWEVAVQANAPAQKWR